MLSPAKGRIQWLSRVAQLAGFGLVLFLFESSLPRPLPWIKPGLANIATLIALYTLGGSAAWIVALSRCLLASFVSGSFLNAAFWLSLAGSSSAALLMILMHRIGRNIFSVVGVGLFGAFGHLLGQLASASALFAGAASIFVLLPVMLLTSVLTGLIVGYASHLILSRLSLAAVTPLGERLEARMFGVLPEH